MPGNDNKNINRGGNNSGGNYIGSHGRQASRAPGSSGQGRAQNAGHGERQARDYRSRVENRHSAYQTQETVRKPDNRRRDTYISSAQWAGQAGAGKSVPAAARNTQSGRVIKYPRKSRLVSFVKIGLTAAAVLIGLYYLLAGVFLSGVNRVRLDTDWDDSPAAAVSDLDLAHRSAVDTVLFIGADGDGGEGSRSDTLMYASYNRLNGRLRLCSVLRDSYVEIPGRRSAKINAALAYGSDELCMRTMECNFRIKTRKFIRVNMEVMAVAIDELGGVELTLSKAEAKAINRHFGESMFSEGTQTLSGQYAVYYARIRKIDDDFHRVSRQRELLSAIAKKSRKTSPLKLCAMLNKCAPYVTTNIPSAELSRLGYDMLIAMSKSGGPEQLIIPAEGTWSYKTINGQSCVVLDIEENALLMRDYLMFRD